MRLEDIKADCSVATLHIDAAITLLDRRFIKGPIPWKWLSLASLEGGKCLAVGVCIWFLSGLKKSNQVKIPTSALEQMGVSRFSYYRAIRKLEAKGLVSVTRRLGAK